MKPGAWALHSRAHGSASVFVVSLSVFLSWFSSSSSSPPCFLPFLLLPSPFLVLFSPLRPHSPLPPSFPPSVFQPPDCSLVRQLAHPGRLAQPQYAAVNGDGGVVHDLSSKTGRTATVVSRHNRPSPERCLYEQVVQECVLVPWMMPRILQGRKLPSRPTN
jgi:hypothetical protein